MTLYILTLKNVENLILDIKSLKEISSNHIYELFQIWFATNILIGLCRHKSAKRQKSANLYKHLDTDGINVKYRKDIGRSYNAPENLLKINDARYLYI